MSKSKFTLPTSFTTLLIITVVVAILTFIIPAGQYLYENGVPVAGTYKAVANNPQGLWDIFAAPVKGFSAAIQISLFVLVLGGCLGIIFETKAIDTGLTLIIKKLQGREKLMIPIVMGVCALGGASYGMAEETIAFYPIIIPILLLAGYDVVTGVMIIFLGAGIGVAASILNPFSVGIASGLAGISIGEGIIHRFVLLLLYYCFGVFFVMRYAAKVKKNPEKSIVYDIREKVEAPFRTSSDEELEMTSKRKLVLGIFISIFIIMIVAIIPWNSKFGITFFQDIHDSILSVPYLGAFLGHMVPLGDWYFTEMTVLFFVGALVIGKAYSYSESQIVTFFLNGAKDLLSVALIIGVAKGISVIMVEGMIIDSILHSGEKLLSTMNSAIFPALTYLLYIPMSFLIPSTSGLATASIPILAPLADFMGLGRELVVTALSAGAESMNFFSPTQSVLIGALALTNVPYARWIKHIFPFVLGIMCITLTVLTIVAML